MAGKKSKAPMAPVSALCDSNAVEDVLFNCRAVLEYLRRVDLSEPEDTERQSEQFRFGRTKILSVVIDALEYTEDVHKHALEVAHD